MGKAFATVFGGSGSKQKATSSSSSTQKSQNSSRSWNNAYDDIKGRYGGSMDNGIKSSNMIASLLGLGSDEEADAGMARYKESTGYENMMDSGVRAVEGSASGRGTLQSGAAARALSDYGQETGKSFFNNYLDKLMGFGDQGLRAGSLVTQAGQESTSQGTSEGQSTSKSRSKGSSYSKPGMSSFLGSLITMGGGGGSGAAAGFPGG